MQPLPTTNIGIVVADESKQGGEKSVAQPEIAYVFAGNSVCHVELIDCLHAM
jgi:hypothetical protein